MKPLGPVYTFAVGSPSNPRAVIKALVDFGVQGATVSIATGLWKGTTERTVQAQVAGITRARAQVIGERLRARFHQEAVFVQSKGNGYLI